MAKLTKKALLKHLNKSDKEDIIGEIITLFAKFKNVKEFYQAELSGDTNPALEKYKKKIAKAYLLPNPKERSTNINLNKLINEFKKICIYDRELVDLMLHRVEWGIDAFTLNRNRSSTFYNCIVSTFEDAVKLIVVDGSINDFRQRINKLTKNTAKGKYNIDERIGEIASSVDY